MSISVKGSWLLGIGLMITECTVNWSEVCPGSSRILNLSKCQRYQKILGVSLIQSDTKKQTIPKLKLLSFISFLTKCNKTWRIFSSTNNKQYVKFLLSSNFSVRISSTCSKWHPFTFPCIFSGAWLSSALYPCKLTLVWLWFSPWC